jgi:hypothetical protein
VTKDWFEARKAQLSTATSTPNAAIWFDPLTKKKFQTQNTYQVCASGGLLLRLSIVKRVPALLAVTVACMAAADVAAVVTWQRLCLLHVSFHAVLVYRLKPGQS